MSSEIGLYEKKYPANWVVMQNKILQAFHKMNIDEKRLLLLASPIARLIDATQDDAIEISAQDYANECNIKVNSAYKQLEAASHTLMNKSFSYKNERGKRVNVQWIIRAVYDEACISVCFTNEVLLMLKVFDKNNPFTKYKKEYVLALKKDYSIDLYHLAKKFEAMGGFTMSLQDYRTELGLLTTYSRINNLKARTLHPAIKEISEKTDINITYENVKRAGVVTGFKFKVKPKISKKKETVGVNKDQESRDIPALTDKQIDRFLNDFTNDPSISSLAPIGMNMETYKIKVRQELRSDKYLQKHKKVLFRVGYKLT